MPTPPARPPSLVAQLAVVLVPLAGVVAFLVMNVALVTGRCSTNEFMVNCAGNEGESTTIVLLAAGGIVLAALTTRAGRLFAAGFFGALIALTVVTSGACTFVWADPYSSAMRQARPYLNRREAEKKSAETRRAWIAAMDARRMDIARGVETAGAVAACARRYAGGHDGRAAASESELAATCDELRTERTAADPKPPGRYVIPVSRGEDPRGQQIAEVRGDAGWRVDYTASAPADFTVSVRPDEQLAHDWPRVTITSSGALEIQVSQIAAARPISPVPDLVTLVECLKSSAADVERHATRYMYAGWYLTSLSRKVCPSLSPRLRAPQPNNSNATLLSLQIPAGGPAAVTVVDYQITFAIRQPPNDGAAFDLLADPTISGLPRYKATFEGEVITSPPDSPRNP